MDTLIKSQTEFFDKLLYYIPIKFWVLRSLNMSLLGLILMVCLYSKQVRIYISISGISQAPLSGATYILSYFMKISDWGLGDELRGPAVTDWGTSQPSSRINALTS